MSLISLSFVLFAFRLGRVYLIGAIVVCAVLMNIFVVKGITLFGLAATGGNILYASIFLATDILDEYWGRKIAFQAVMIGFFASVFFLITSQLILLFEPANFDMAHGALKTIFTLTPRIVAGSMVAYLAAQSLDVYIFNKIKKKTSYKHLWLRNLGSTLSSQLIDSAIFTLIAFAGVYHNLLQIMFFAYIIKVMIAFLDTPFLYLTRHLKPNELLHKNEKSHFNFSWFPWHR